MTTVAFPTDSFELLHYQMVRAHETFKIGYNNIIKHLDEKEKIEHDLANFVGYCLAWVFSIECHHTSEEEIVFPFLNQKMDFSGEHEAHQVIHKGLSDLEAVLKEAQVKNELDASKVKEQFVQLRDALFSHLDEEVEHIKSEELKKAGFSAGELKAANTKLEEYARSHGDPWILIPYMRSHTPAEFKEHWPPMPWILRRVVIPFIFARKHKGYWKYSPYPVQ